MRGRAGRVGGWLTGGAGRAARARERLTGGAGRAARARERLTGGARLTGRRSVGGGRNGPGPLDLRRTARAGLGLFKIEPFDLR
jgi:hypothetical protein